MRSSQIAVISAVAASVLLSCSSSDNGTVGPVAGGHSTTIVASSVTRGGAYGSGGNFFFSPNPDTVSAGATVTFQIGTVAHNVHFDPVANAPDSVATTSNASVDRGFPVAGTYTFHCTIHNFSGTLVVQ